ncbi:MULTISPECIES: 50S ribosomal protein L19e [Halococcus]|uniref:Large ribosomal subunit protein eL19 n=1 Tax=Halococcus salifodinae DSM 8989 TaxID=1227456 RepID=M0MY78_9EURY|nr:MULTISPECIES: 50S ribosomal protein L19e [Halococcus]EMA49370.1 50S ribosomal protein L19e [Halococcus salifodinae DSM 8989]
MTDLTAQRRLAADVLDCGENRVWFDPEAQGEIAEAITREDIREQVANGTIESKAAKSNSRGRARERDKKRAAGHRSGPGTRKGTAGARENSKDAWVSRIRAQRRRLKELRADGTLDRTQYRALYDKAGGGEFDSVDRLETFATNEYDVTIEDE